MSVAKKTESIFTSKIAKSSSKGDLTKAEFAERQKDRKNLHDYPNFENEKIEEKS